MIFAIIVCCCVQKFKNSIIKDLQAGNGSIITAPPYGLNLVQVWKVDAATIERFLHEIAKEKIVRFTAQELCSFTNNYSIRLGSGGFGVVYEGQFPNGIRIAVKVLNRNSNNKKVEEQFMAEVGTIVYEFMENSSLDKFLFTAETPQIEWELLQEIAIGTAKGLPTCMKSVKCQQRIIHYDIKPGNVLLDSNFSPKVADFGLAKLCNKDITHVSCSGCRGTPGYSAPEFLMHSYPITHKCDVYSFGMLLFEIARRRRNTNTNTDTDDTLDWFPKKAWEEFEMFMVALWCVQDSPESRPLMSTVVKMLEGRVEILLPLNPFRYLYGLGTGDVAGGATVSNSYSTTVRTNLSRYESTTPVMRKYEIQIASS
ncbi:hypothetical protein MKX01_022867 [Papaver californicum]|nr:hypothetical protein MKX01_022867 [Papaver californicum]